MAPTVEKLTAARTTIPAAALTLVLVLGGCGPGAADARCDRRPPAGADYGTCERVLGAYYDPFRGACILMSGCECDATCQERELPFASVAECEDACTSVQTE